MGPRKSPRLNVAAGARMQRPSVTMRVGISIRDHVDVCCGPSSISEILMLKIWSSRDEATGHSPWILHPY